MTSPSEERVGEKLAPFNPSSQPVIDCALEMLRLGPGDVLFDLGCGDGRVLVEACRRTGAQGVGIEYDGALVRKARQAVENAGVCDSIQIRHESLEGVDLDKATAVFVYLVPEGMKLVAPKLASLIDRGGRVVAYGESLNACYLY
jgi:cyclopropane fatty-acyl-phospholipid synthase-like methyltransferase